jgi:hypothetical protein
LVDDHERVTTSPTITDAEDDDNVTVGDGVDGVDDPPPPPPPPHAAINKTENKIFLKFLTFISFLNKKCVSCVSY